MHIEILGPGARGASRPGGALHRWLWCGWVCLLAAQCTTGAYCRTAVSSGERELNPRLVAKWNVRAWGQSWKCSISYMLKRHHTLSNHESKPKLGYHASSKHLRCRAPPGPATTAPRPNTTHICSEKSNKTRAHVGGPWRSWMRLGMWCEKSPTSSCASSVVASPNVFYRCSPHPTMQIMWVGINAS